MKSPVYSRLLIIGWILYLIIQIIRVYNYYYFSSHIYADVVSVFPTNPSSVWSHQLAYTQEPNLTLTSDFCQIPSNPSDHLSVLVVISSTVSRHETRAAIRKSWATYFYKKTWTKANVIFAIGKDAEESEEERKILKWEIDQFNDILIIDLLDTYHNLSLKSAWIFGWVESKCPAVDFVLKCDDDTVVFGDNLMRYLEEYYSGELKNGAAGTMGREEWSPAVHCYVFKWSMVMRQLNRRKDFVPFELYHGRYYPPFCSGHAYILTQSAIRLLVSHLKILEFYYHLEDVLLTGIVARMARIKLVSRHEFHGEHFDSVRPFPQSDPRWKDAYETYFTLHYVKKTSDILNLWRNYVAAVKSGA